MSQTEPTRQSDDIWPPIVGSIMCFPLTTGVLVVDMTSFPQSAALPQSKLKGSEHTSPLAQYLTMVCPVAWDIAFAATSGALASLSDTQTVTVAQSGAAAFQIPSGASGNEVVQWPGGVPLNV